MKTQIISAIGAGLFSLMVVNSASAQQPTRTKVLPQVIITSSNTPVSERVLKNFARSYKEAENIRWTEINKRFLVKFDENDMQHQAVYMKGGYQVYHIGYGFENNLPANIRQMVKSSYHDYDIKRVFNVDQDNRQIWVVNLLTPKSFVTARIENGELQEIHRRSNASLTDPQMTMIKK